MIRTQPGPLSLEIESRAEITGSGLSIPEGLSFDEWLGVGRKLMLADKAVQWAIGDWWIYGDHRYGERASAAIDPATGENRLTRYMQYGWVARSIETSRRREVLSWSAHLEVAALEPNIQDGILSRAVENGWGSREVRAAVKEFKDRLAGGNKPKLSAQTPDVEDAEVVEETDAAVFDATPAGAAMAAQKAERERPEFTASTAQQSLLDAMKAMDAALMNRGGLDYETLSAEKLFALADRIKSLAAEVQHAHETKWKSARRPAPAGADREGDGKSSPRTPDLKTLTQGGEEASRLVHTQEIVGASPAPATNPASSPPDTDGVALQPLSPATPSTPIESSTPRAEGSTGGADIPVTAPPGEESVVPPTHSNPAAVVAREASTAGQGGAEVSVTAPPEPDIPAFLDRRNRA